MLFTPIGDDIFVTLNLHNVSFGVADCAVTSSELAANACSMPFSTGPDLSPLPINGCQLPSRERSRAMAPQTQNPRQKANQRRQRDHKFKKLLHRIQLHLPEIVEKQLHPTKPT